MKRYVLTLLITASAAACSTNKPAVVADDSQQVATVEPTGADPMLPASSEDTTNTPDAADADTNDSNSAASQTWGTESSSSTRTTSNAPVGGSPTAPDPAPATLPPSPAPATAAAPPGTAPDNTKVNQRDSNTAALTPVDQGNNQSDLKITQQIRQAVMANGSLSFNAKNVKIITVGGKVTLRGPVSNDQERSAIEAAAKKVAGATNVENQIEVKK